MDLEAYVARIGVEGAFAPDLETLRALHLAHVTAIPFENLDIFLGRPIQIDLPSIEAKLVRMRRGGYCFEHNSLFAAVLEAIGFRVTRLGARVGDRDPRTLKRTHMILRVEAGGVDHLADVGFGAGGLFEPIPIAPGEAWDQFGRSYRTVPTQDGFAFEDRRDGEWRMQYQFTLEEMFASDYAVANHYTSTHPDSGFVRTLTAQRRTTGSEWVLRSWELTEVGPEVEVRTIVDGADSLLQVLATVFGLSFPPGTTFRPPGAGALPRPGLEGESRS